MLQGYVFKLRFCIFTGGMLLKWLVLYLKYMNI